MSLQESTNRGKVMLREDTVNRQQKLYKTSQLIWLITGVLEALIGLRILLKLLAANPVNPFANFVYDITWLFVWPFLGLTATPSVEGMVLEIPSIIAMLVYALLAWLIVRVFYLLFE